MEIITTELGWVALLRWFHLLAGVCWIGLLWYFDFVQTPFFESELGAPARRSVVRGLMPSMLRWLRWSATFAVLAGLSLALISFREGPALTGPYATQILTGGLVGILLWINVWFAIRPAERDLIAGSEPGAGGADATRQLLPRAAVACRISTLLSIPMLFLMSSASHFHFAEGDNWLLYWLITGALLLLVELPALTAPGFPIRKLVRSVPSTISAGLGLTLVFYLIGVVVP